MITINYSGVTVQHVAVKAVIEGERLNVYGRAGDLVAAYPSDSAEIISFS